MPRKRDPEGKPQKFKMLPSQQMQQEAYSHASPPKGRYLTVGIFHLVMIMKG